MSTKLEELIDLAVEKSQCSFLTLLVQGETEEATVALTTRHFDKDDIKEALSALYRVNWEVGIKDPHRLDKDPLQEMRILELLRLPAPDMEIVQFTPDHTTAKKLQDLIALSKRRWDWGLQMEIAVTSGDLTLFYFVALMGNAQDFIRFLQNTSVKMTEKYLAVLRTFNTATIQEALTQYVARPKPEEVVIHLNPEPQQLLAVPLPVEPINIELTVTDDEPYWSNIMTVTGTLSESIYFGCLKQYLQDKFPTSYDQVISHNKATILDFILGQLQDYPSVDTFTLLRTRVPFPGVQKENFSPRYRDIIQTEGDTLTLSLADALSFQRRPWASKFTESAQYALSLASDLTKTQKTILFLEQTINRLKQANARKPKEAAAEKIRFLEAAVKHLENKDLKTYSEILSQKIPGFHDLSIEESLKHHRGATFFWQAPRSYKEFARFTKTEREAEKVQASLINPT